VTCIEEERGTVANRETRFGDETDIPASNPLLKTILAPSRVLEQNNLEVLVASLNFATASPSKDAGNATQEALLVPTLETPTSSSGRFSHVTYPVHKTILLGNGAESLIDYGRFIGSLSDSELPPNTVKIAVNLPSPEATAPEEPDKAVLPINLDLAEKSLAKFRESLSNATVYEQGWFKSGLPSIQDWLVAGTTSAQEDGLKPAVQALVTSLLTSTIHQISLSTAEAIKSASQVSNVDEATRLSLSKSLDIWAESAHTELRDQLDIAFSSAHWSRLKWWKLFWRVDDVGMISSEVLERRWLIDAEKNLVFLAGRVVGAGLANASTISAPSGPGIPAKNPKKDESLPTPTLGELMKTDIDAKDQGAITPLRELKPWPMSIPLTRMHLAKTTIPSLQALSQKLLLQTLSTVSLSTAISALAFVTVSSTSVFEAGAVAAFGLVLSLKRLQSRWEGAREFWEGELREEGRKALMSTEEDFRRALDVKKGVVDKEVLEDLKSARGAVERAVEVLQEAGK
jgi:hypothetical protein